MFGRLGLGLGLGGSVGGDPMLAFQAINETNPTAPTDYGAISGLDENFTLYLEFTDNAFQSGDDSFIFFLAEAAGTFNNYIALQKRDSAGDPLRLIVRSGGSTILDIYNFLPNYLNGRHKLALSCKDGEILMYLDGLRIVNRDTAFTYPDNFNDGLNIGQANSGIGDFGGTFQKCEFYTEAVTNVTSEAWLRNKTLNPYIIAGKTFDSSLDILAFAGQSNSSGVASGSPSYTNIASMKMIRNNFAVETYSDPYDDDTGSLLTSFDDTTAALSHAGFMLDEILDSVSGTFAAAPLNKAGTSMNTNWGQDLSLSAFNQTGAGTKHAGSQLSAFIQGLITLKTMGNLRAIVWHQGELDAYDAVSQSAYEDYLEGMFNAVWGAVGNIPVILNTLHEWDAGITAATEAEWNAIISAQTAWAATKSNVYLNDISDLTGASGDKVHLDASGQQTAGERAASLYVANIG